MSNFPTKAGDTAPRTRAGRVTTGLFMAFLALGPVAACSGDSTPQPDDSVPSTTMAPPTTEIVLGDGCASPVIDAGETIWGEALKYAGVGTDEVPTPAQEELIRRYTDILTDRAAELGYTPTEIPAGTDLQICPPLPE